MFPSDPRESNDLWVIERFAGRLKAFAEQEVRLGYNVNFGNADLAAALAAARSANPYLGPADNLDAIDGYFTRTDLVRASSSYLHIGGFISELPDPLTPQDVIDLTHVAGTPGSPYPGIWDRIFDQAANGQIDLGDALTWVKAAGGQEDATTKATAKIFTDLKALLTAPLTNAEYANDRDGKPQTAETVALDGQLAQIAQTATASGSFQDLLLGLEQRIALQPQFAEVVQAYLQYNKVSLADPLSGEDFFNLLPNVGNFTIADPLALLKTLPGTVVGSDGSVTNRYLPTNFFDQTQLSDAHGASIAQAIAQYQLLPGEDNEIPSAVAFDPGPLPPPPPPGPPNPGDPTPPPPTPPGSYWEYDHTGPGNSTTYRLHNTDTLWTWAPPPGDLPGYILYDNRSDGHGGLIFFRNDYVPDLGHPGEYQKVGETVLFTLPVQPPTA